MLYLFEGRLRAFVVETFEFEAPERIALYRALLLARLGNRSAALQLLETIGIREITEDEQNIRSHIIDEKTANPYFLKLQLRGI